MGSWLGLDCTGQLEEACSIRTVVDIVPVLLLEFATEVPAPVDLLVAADVVAVANSHQADIVVAEMIAEDIGEEGDSFHRDYWKK